MINGIRYGSFKDTYCNVCRIYFKIIKVREGDIGIDETKLAMSWQFLNLDDEYMGVYYTTVFSLLFMLEISFFKKETLS